MFSAAQIWHDLISEVERAVAPIKHLFNEHEAGFNEAIGKLRQQADAEVGHLVGDAEAAAHTAVGQLEADAAPIVDEGKTVLGDLANTARTDAEQLLSGAPGAQPAPTEAAPAADSSQGAETAQAPTEQSSPEPAA